MKTIYKYTLAITDFQSIELPKDSQILSVQAQQGQPCLWALVDPKAPKVKRNFAIHGTGHPVEKAHRKIHIGTFKLSAGNLVFHCFEIFPD